MAEPVRKKNLGTQETIWVFSLVFLLSGLMFSVGLWVGYGFRPASEKTAAALAEHESNHEFAGHESKQKDESNDRKPASQVSAEDRGGEGLRAEFFQDKRDTLARETLARDASQSPKSIEDANAHLALHTEWDRNPAAVKEAGEEDPKTRAEAASAKERARFKQGPPQTVKGLFERGPDAIEAFEPQPGRYTVQIASFATEDEAKAKITTLRSEGFQEAYYRAVQIRGKETWYRVFVGSFPTPVWAKRTGEKLKKQRMTTDFAIREVN